MYKTNAQIMAEIAELDRLLGSPGGTSEPFDVEPTAAIAAVKAALKESELLVDIAGILIDSDAFFEVDDELRARLEPIAAALEVASRQRPLNEAKYEHYRYPELEHAAFMLWEPVNELLKREHAARTPLRVADALTSQVDELRKLTAKYDDEGKVIK